MISALTIKTDFIRQIVSWVKRSYRRLPALLLGLVMAAPLFFLAEVAFFGEDEHAAWDYILRISLERYMGTTILLALGVTSCALLWGLGSAWLVTLYRFPLSGALRMGLLFPLAVPSYIIAFVYTDLFPYQNIRSLGGAIIVLSLVLYPYVYLFSRAALLEQSACVFEAGRILGCGVWRNFYRVGLPLLRPALAASGALVVMETLADFGTVQYFALPVFTVGIYDAWLTMLSITAAAKLSIVLLVFILAVILLEFYGRRGCRYHPIGMKKNSLPEKELHGFKKWLACLFCLALIMAGFGIPIWFLASQVFFNSQLSMSGDFLIYALNSVTSSFLAAIVAGLLGFVLSWSCLPPASPMLAVSMRVASIGYAIPGAVLAIGVMMTLAAADSFFQVIWGQSFLLLSSLLGLIYGYVARFMAIPHGLMRASLERVTPQMEDAARTLGHSSVAIVRRIYVPMVRRSFWAAVLFVFVECMKELPLTLLTRPLNYETLATWIWQYASEERFTEVAHGALLLVMVGMVPVILMSRAMSRGEGDERLMV